MDDISRKKIILEYIRLGQRLEAIDYIMKVYNVNELEAERLLLAVSVNAGESAKILEKPAPSGSGGCGGCVGAAFKLGSIIFMMMSLFMLIMVGAIYYFIEQEKSKLVELEGEIVGLKGARNDKVYPIVEYQWETNVYKDTSAMAVGPNEFKLHEKAEIYIHPDYPGNAYLEKELSMNALDTFKSGDAEGVSDLQIVELIFSGVTYFLLIPGLIFFLLSIVFWIIGNRMRR